MDEEERRFKEFLVIAGASHAVDFLEKNPKATKEQAIKDVTKNASKIIEKIDAPI